ncbi:hypothetical protein [Nisaea sp.]|uniref:hypothetical protein n=1 Tax=Nisaea sp. TaxID=2024842 RepID=UPI00326476F9
MASDTMPIIAEGISWDTSFEDLPNTHPRGAGSFARALRMWRENGITLMQSISQLNYNSARPLGEMGLKAMQERDRMQEGMVADITIFNPATVTDTATYVQGALPSEGIPYVIVNGTIVVKEAEVLKDVNPGQPICYEPTESRREPLSVESWINTSMLCRRTSVVACRERNRTTRTS